MIPARPLVRLVRYSLLLALALAPSAGAATIPGHVPAPGAHSELINPSPGWSFESDVANRSLGQNVTTVGDVNGDGYSDMISRGNGGSTSPLYLFFGGPNGPTLAPGYPIAITPLNGVFTAAGDVNGDGHADLLAYWITPPMVRIYFGNANGFSLTGYSQIASGIQSTGMLAGPAGDLNGDGYDDIIMGQPAASSQFNCGAFPPGLAWVFYGDSTGISMGRSWVLAGQCSGGMGSSVAGAGDVNGDGFDDVIIGAPGTTDISGAYHGLAYIVYGSSTGLPFAFGTNNGTLAGATTLTGAPYDYASFGSAVSTAGDVDGDGFADVAVGAPYDDYFANEAGSVRVFHGSVAGADTSKANLLWFETGGAAFAHFGNFLMPAGDVNGDGRADLLVLSATSAVLVQSAGIAETAVQVLPSYGVTPTPDNIATAGDVNGDGISDLVFGQTSYTNGQSFEGRVLVHYGTGKTFDVATPNWSSTTAWTNPNYGWSVSSAGDVNGDGFDDVLVGAPSAYSSDGLVQCFLGSATGVALTPSFAVAGNTSDQLGVSVAAAGDVNGDGYGDIIVGGHQPGTGNGFAWVWYGGPSGLVGGAPNVVLTGFSFDSRFGTSVAGVGDVNGDGYADVVVGAPYDQTNGHIADEGRAFLYLGSSTGLSTTPVWSASGGQAGALFGSCVSPAGDVNGDGLSDFAVGAPSYDYTNLDVTYPDAGRFDVYTGRSDGQAQLSTTVVDRRLLGIGTALAWAGDVNGDGYSDVIMGAPNSASSLTGEGYAAVYAGGPGGMSSTPLWSQFGGQAFGDFGSSVAGAGDVNGDSLSDIVVGAVFQDGPGQDAGKAHLYAAPLTNGASPIQTFSGPSAFANMGHSLANAGDVNNDGWSDLIFGEPGFTASFNRQGRVEMHYGSTGGALYQAAIALRSSPSVHLVPPLGLTNPGQVYLLGTGRSAAGRTRVRMHWKVAPTIGIVQPTLTGVQSALTPTGTPGANGSVAAVIQSVANLAGGVPYSWRFRSLSRSIYYPTSIWRSSVRNGTREADLRAPAAPLDVANGVAGGTELMLADVQPNPMHGLGTISFALPRSGDVTLEVLDLQGRHVRSLLRGFQAAGPHQVRWDGRFENGQLASAGVYFVRLRAAGRALSRKVALLP